MNLIERIKKLEYNVAKLLARSFMYYAKSTYTPTYVGGTTAGVTTYSAQDGNYVQIGSLVVATGRVIWTAATGTGEARISLPFTPAARGAAGPYTVNVTFANGSVQILIAGTPYFTLLSPATNAAGTTVQVEAAGEIRWTIAFLV